MANSIPVWKRLILLLAAPVSGLLLSFCFSPYDQFYIAWFALVPLLYSIRGSSPAGAALRGYLFGAAFLGSVFWWFSVCRYPAVLGFIAFTVIIPIAFIPWAVLTNRLMRNGAGALWIWLPAAFWVAVEWIMSQGTFAFPWWSLGNTQARNLIIAQAASLGGSYLISFILILANFFVYALITRRAASTRWSWVVAGALVAVLAARGAVILGTTGSGGAAGSDDAVSIALIQPSFPQDEKDDGSLMPEMYHTHKEMTDDAVEKGDPDIVVWSESVTFLSWLTDGYNYKSLMEYLGRQDIMLVSGVYEFADEKMYNAVVAVDPEEGVVGKYRKMQLVPFGEMVPGRKQVERISPALGEWINETVYENDVAAGNEYTIFKSRHGDFAAVICFESVIPAITRKMTRLGAGYIFIITNDAWFLDTPGAYQHAQLAAMRAVETRRYIVQAANSGVSVFIDPYGRVLSETEVFDKTILAGTVRPMREITFYTRHGDIFAICCFGFSVYALGFFGVQKLGAKMRQS